MDIRIQVTIEYDNTTTTQTIAQFQRDDLQAETLGITLNEAKEFLIQLQQQVVTQQVAQFNQQHRMCPDCHTPRHKKDTKRIIYRTAFGKLELASPRYYTCDCQPRSQKSESPLTSTLSERTSPELSYLQTKWAALMSYGLTTELLNDVLPINLCQSSVQHHVHQIAQRMEDELEPEQHFYVTGTPDEVADLPQPAGRLAVGIDGAFIHARDGDNRKNGWFEVIVGKSITSEQSNRCFGFVTTYDDKSKRRLNTMLLEQGFQLNQNITFFSDGGDNVRDLQLYLSPHAEHVLDWFHVTMRITQMRQKVKGLPDLSHDFLNPEKIDRDLESIKWYLWHGNTTSALERIESLFFDLEEFGDDLPKWVKLCRAVGELLTYIRNNQAYIPNYGERHHYGEYISTGFVESAVNHIISKRFVKKQQMRWTKRGAHLLIQIRTKVLDDQLHSVFQRWYPNMADMKNQQQVA